MSATHWPSRCCVSQGDNASSSSPTAAATATMMSWPRSRCSASHSPDTTGTFVSHVVSTLCAYFNIWKSLCQHVRLRLLPLYLFQSVPNNLWTQPVLLHGGANQQMAGKAPHLLLFQWGWPEGRWRHFRRYTLLLRSFFHGPLFPSIMNETDYYMIVTKQMFYVLKLSVVAMPPGQSENRARLSHRLWFAWRQHHEHMPKPLTRIKHCFYCSLRHCFHFEC